MHVASFSMTELVHATISTFYGKEKKIPKSSISAWLKSLCTYLHRYHDGVGIKYKYLFYQECYKFREAA